MQLTCAALIERGDIALATRDATTLALVARQLAKHMGDPLTARLTRFAADCAKPGVHSREWTVLRRAVRDRIAIAGT